jgi:hypothetical protein
MRLLNALPTIKLTASFCFSSSFKQNPRAGRIRLTLEGVTAAQAKSGLVHRTKVGCTPLTFNQCYRFR